MNSDFKYDDELKNEAPKLFSMEKKNPFIVPDNYFDSLTSKIQDRIAAEKKESFWSVLIKTVIQPKFAVPVLASVCLVVVGIRFLYHPASITPPAQVAVTYEDLSKSDYINDIDEHVFVEALNKNAGNATSATTNADIENYLIENNIEEGDLVKALN